jgi:hypothetical protein
MLKTKILTDYVFSIRVSFPTKNVKITHLSSWSISIMFAYIPAFDPIISTNQSHISLTSCFSMRYLAFFFYYFHLVPSSVVWSAQL